MNKIKDVRHTTATQWKILFHTSLANGQLTRMWPLVQFKPRVRNSDRTTRLNPSSLEVIVIYYNNPSKDPISTKSTTPFNIHITNHNHGTLLWARPSHSSPNLPLLVLENGAIVFFFISPTIIHPFRLHS
ncbi:hypothetical protein L2E82_22370 [Cichorium intybus]|uniref:Uncharacterized protein n=1 Tax=Cichorium intybus TaxID=13427 RepID=A0ACB9DY95_CICIN|nr:hypothetical protein L2E82_22370 [Cichorium intybus]